MSPTEEDPAAETPGEVDNLAAQNLGVQIQQRMSELGDFIREQRRLARLSVRKLSEMAGVSNPYLSQIERGLRHPSAEVLQAIARALRMSSETLYVRAGILEQRDEEGDLALHIFRANELSEIQKQTLLSVYQAFLAENRSKPESTASR